MRNVSQTYLFYEYYIYGMVPDYYQDEIGACEDVIIKALDTQRERIAEWFEGMGEARCNGTSAAVVIRNFKFKEFEEPPE